jgi:hypothetical protein
MCECVRMCVRARECVSLSLFLSFSLSLFRSFSLSLSLQRHFTSVRLSLPLSLSLSPRLNPFFKKKKPNPYRAGGPFRLPRFTFWEIRRCREKERARARARERESERAREREERERGERERRVRERERERGRCLDR